MPLENRDLTAGTRLAGHYKGKRRTCEVVSTDDGLRFRLDDGTEHRSPSSAGRAAMGGVACNGWRFWSLDSDLAENAPRKAKSARAAKPAKKAPARKAATRKRAAAKKNATGKRASRRASYGCGVCRETFPTMKAATAHALTHTAA